MALFYNMYIMVFSKNAHALTYSTALDSVFSTRIPPLHLSQLWAPGYSTVESPPSRQATEPRALATAAKNWQLITLPFWHYFSYLRTKQHLTRSLSNFKKITRSFYQKVWFAICVQCWYLELSSWKGQVIIVWKYGNQPLLLWILPRRQKVEL